MKDIFTSVWLLKLVLLLFGFIPFLASTLDLINLPKPTSSISSFSDKPSFIACTNTSITALASCCFSFVSLLRHHGHTY